MKAHTTGAITSEPQVIENTMDDNIIESHQYISVEKSTLDYCVPASDNCYDRGGFKNFTFAGIENFESGCSPGGYGDFTSMQGTAEFGDTYTLSIRQSFYSQYVSIWIAVDRFNKKFVNFVIGDRSNKTAKRFWESIKHHEMGVIASDYRKPYESIIPNEKHVQYKAETFTVGVV